MNFPAIKNVTSLKMHQKKDFSELFFEKGNRYVILDGHNQEMAFINEKKSNFLVRMFLKNMRSYNISIFDRNKTEIMNCKFPFAFWRREFSIHDGSGKTVAKIKTRFKWFRRCFDLFDEAGAVVFSSESKASKIWTFPIQKNGREVCLVKKKWSGFGKELFTNADNFTIEFSDAALTERDKVLLLGASIFIDLAYFEYKG